MTSFTSQVPSKVLKSVALAWFEVLYSCLRYSEKRSLKEVDEESGYGSDGQEKSLIARAEYRIACESAGDFEGKPKELPATAIANKILERYMEYLLQKTGGGNGGQGCFEFTYRVGFSNRPWCFLGGSWQSLTRIPGACEVLAHHWSKGKVDFKLMGCMRKNRSPVFEDMLFTVKIRLFVRESCMISAILSTHRILLTTRNGQFCSKNNHRAITKESESLQSLCTFLSGSKCSSYNDILAVKSSKWQGIEWSESEGPHGTSFLPRIIKRSLQTSSSDKLAVGEKGNEKEFRGSYCFPAEASNAPLTPPSTPTSEDSSSLVSSPPLSPEEGYNYWKVKDPMHHLRQILLTELQAKGIATDKDGKNGSPQSRFEAPIIELTPPDSPEREYSMSSSSSPPPEHVGSFKDLYSKDGHQPLLGSCGRFSSALKHFGTSIFQPLAKEQEYCPYGIPYAIDLLKPRYSAANELGTLPDFEHGLTGRPDEGKSKLFGTWTNLPEDTPTSSSAFVDQFQHGFYANDNCWLMKMVEDLLEDLSDGCQT